MQSFSESQLTQSTDGMQRFKRNAGTSQEQREHEKQNISQREIFTKSETLSTTAFKEQRENAGRTFSLKKCRNCLKSSDQKTQSDADRCFNI